MKNKNKITNQCTRKKRFKDIELAKKAIRSIKKRDNVFMRYYMCKYCEGYHLTSKRDGEFGST